MLRASTITPQKTRCSLSLALHALMDVDKPLDEVVKTINKRGKGGAGRGGAHKKQQHAKKTTAAATSSARIVKPGRGARIPPFAKSVSLLLGKTVVNARRGGLASSFARTASAGGLYSARTATSATRGTSRVQRGGRGGRRIALGRNAAPLPEPEPYTRVRIDDHFPKQILMKSSTTRSQPSSRTSGHTISSQAPLGQP